MSLTRNAKIVVTDTPGDTIEAKLFDKTLHFSYDVVIPRLLSDHIDKVVNDVAEAMSLAATTVLFDLATQVQDMVAKKLADKLHDTNLN